MFLQVDFYLFPVYQNYSSSLSSKIYNYESTGKCFIARFTDTNIFFSVCIKDHEIHVISQMFFSCLAIGCKTFGDKGNVSRVDDAEDH